MKQDLFANVKPATIITIKDIKHGECFMSGGNKYMKIFPVTSLLNSTLIKDVIKRGDCFAVNLETGDFTVFPSTKNCIPLNRVYREEYEKKKEKEFYIPETPGGNLCIWLIAKTEEQAWTNLLIDDAHMPDNTKENFIKRGFSVVKVKVLF